MTDLDDRAPLAFVDTETTGLDPDVHEIWEVGLIVRRPNGTEAAHRWLLPVDLERADRRALAIGRFADRHPWGQHYTGTERLTERAAFALHFMQLTSGAHLVGNVVSFDEERLRRLLLGNNKQPSWHYHLVDVECLIAGRFGYHPPWKSTELSELVGVKVPEDQHAALSDAYWAMEMYDAVMSITGTAS